MVTISTPSQIIRPLSFAIALATADPAAIIPAHIFRQNFSFLQLVGNDTPFSLKDNLGVNWARPGKILL